jgi:hypothetical protein
MFKRLFTILFVLAISVNFAFANGTITGVVKSESGDPLPGASVYLTGVKIGDYTNSDGKFDLNNVKPGKYTVRVTYMGYAPSEKIVTIKGSESIILNFKLGEVVIESEAISVVASRAQTRETPVAFSDVPKQQIAEQLGSRDIPMILNTTPGVYATDLGGGAGDSRINIRGFDQRNVSVMINGVPVNDMENGWVYWSNWDGLGDVTSSIQVQRGLGAGRMANPSVGGTMNIISDAANQKAGISVKQEIAAGEFLKTTLVGNTGKIGNFAATFAGVRKTAEGVVDKTWTDAWAYYLGLSYDLSKNHQLDFYVIGAPQQHGQRNWQSGIATYSHELAKDAGVADSIIKKTTEMGYTSNKDWGKLDPATGKSIEEYYYGSKHDLRDNESINQRVNYFHKPQMNLNWFWKMNDKMSLTNVFYLSIGRGGGSSPTSIAWDASGNADFQGAYNYNTSSNAIDKRYSDTLHKSKGVLFNSVNQHVWYGYLGTFEMKPTDNLTIQTGIDWRSYTGQHWREIRNLIGGDYYYDNSDKTQDYTGANAVNGMRTLGDKAQYNNDGQVNWIGGFAQGEIKIDKLTAYFNSSVSNTGYQRIDYFRPVDGTKMANGIGKETDVENFLGYTVKTGANYNYTNAINFYGNVGYYSRAPLFRNVFNTDNSLYSNLNNEKVTAVELGTGYYKRQFRANVNLYWTVWKDRSWYTQSNYTVGGVSQTFYYNLPGIGADHKGVEFDFSYRPIKQIKLTGMLSVGDWKWTSDVEATYTPEGLVDSLGNPVTFKKNLYLKDLKVGDAAQTTAALTLHYYPMDRASISITYNHFANYYSNFNPEARSFVDKNGNPDRKQSWKIPSYGLVNAHFNMTLPFDLPFEIKVFAHAYNLLDTEYISDAVDNAAHDANTDRVWVGMPRRWNVGMQIAY